jgi:hypothetical protein
MTAAGIIAVGGTCYAAAAGKVASSGTIIEGIALEAATADGDIIEVAPLHNVDASTASTGTTSATWTIDSDSAAAKLAFDTNSATGDFTLTVVPPNLSANGIVTLPASTSTLATLAGAETLTNKTLTAPNIAVIGMTGTTGNQEIRLTANLADALSIEDSSGDLLVFTTTTGALAINSAARFSATGCTINTAGVGITGTATSFVASVIKEGTLIKTTIVIDLEGLDSGGTADDIIGANGAGVAHLGQITAAVNGTIIGGRLTCLETPATGDDDIDVWAATESTGVEDTAIAALEETKLCNSGNLTAGSVVILDPPAANKYLYLCGGTGDSQATYTAGKLMLEFWGK